MERFKFWNRVTGWMVFAIATISYWLTIEPTTSMWDCSEFIATSYKLEVGHPPGAPLFMMLARIASLLAPTPEDVPMMINGMNALASGFCILFLFWTITHLARRITNYEQRYLGPMSSSLMIAILGAGAVGALSYAYTDTFWFSAVEGEVYALSSMFTALVVWLMLKWEENFERHTSMRWIILIAYLMGLSIGVHILNLLTIPALVMIYFFRRYECKNRWRYTLMMGGALLISLLILGAINGLIIPYTVALGAAVDTFAVNTLGMPVNSGMIIFIVAVFALLGVIIYTSHRKGQRVVNGIAMALTVILIGFSSYASITIRASANPPMNSNNPSTPHTLLSLLNRDQYGQRPLLSGPYYSAVPLSMTTTSPDTMAEDYYIPTGNYDSKSVMWLNPETGVYEEREFFEGYRYPESANRLFPRMWHYSRRSSYESSWIDMSQGHPSVLVDDGEGGRWYEHTAGEDIGFFFNYQMGQMFGRYFLWNFVGRQDDSQVVYDAGNNIFLHGGWLSGIDSIDEIFCGPQTNLPSEMAGNEARNTYFFLPLLLGLLGLIYQLNTDWRNFIVVLLLFVMMGIALVVYFNTAPDEPRERDYVYAGAFYAFSIWIGLGVMAIYDILVLLCSRLKSTPKVLNYAALTAVVLCMSVPVVLATENWDDHDRSDRYFARAIGRNFLNTVPENAILINYGDNDTFPLWYCQEVEGERLDVRVMNSSYLGGEWYIDEMKLAANAADAVPFTIPSSRYSFVNDWVMVANIVDVLDTPQARALVGEKRRVEDQSYYTIRYQDISGRTLSFSGSYNDITRRLNQAANTIDELSPILDEVWAEYGTIPNEYYDISIELSNAYDIYDAIIEDAQFMADYESVDRYWQLNDALMAYPLMLKDAIRLFVSDTAMTLAINNGMLRILDEGETIPQQERAEDYAIVGRLRPQIDSHFDGNTSDYILGAANYVIPVNRDAVLSTGLLSEAEAVNMVDEICITLGSSMITKDHLMMLDLFAHFDWQRPISFTQAHLMSDYGVANYARFDGYSYTLVPILTPISSGREVGTMNIDALYPLFSGEGTEDRRALEFGNIGNEEVYADYFSRYNISASRIRENFARVAHGFITRANNDDLTKAEALLDRGLEVMPGEQLGYAYNNTQPYILGYYSIANIYMERAAEELVGAIEIMNRALDMNVEVAESNDIFGYFYDLSDSAAELHATAQHRLQLGQQLNVTTAEFAEAEQQLAVSDTMFEHADKLFTKGDILTMRYMAKRAEWARYFLQYATYEHFSPMISDELYNAMLDIIEALQISHTYAGSFDIVAYPTTDHGIENMMQFDALVADYLAAIARLTPSSTTSATMSIIEPHMLNLFDIYTHLPSWGIVDGQEYHASYAEDLENYLNRSVVYNTLATYYRE